MRAARCRRSGKTLVLFALVLPALLGMGGLMIDLNLLMGAQREAQNAADAAALAAAFDLMRSKSGGQVIQTAKDFVQNYNGMTKATVTCSGASGPSKGPYAGNTHFVEVIVANPVQTYFVQMVGVAATQTAQARAVAGFIALSAGEGIGTFNPNAVPGLLTAGNAVINVHGRVVVNSQGSGVDENGKAVNLGLGQYAAQFNGNHSILQADAFYIAGGVDTPSRFTDTSGKTGVLHAGVLPEQDPLLFLPTPTMSSPKYWSLDASGNPLSAASPQAVTASGNATLNPGVYQSISVTAGSGKTVTFNPGVYIVGVNNSNSNTTPRIDLGGSAKINGNGVMFYNTGNDFNVVTGLPDSNDGSTLGTTTSKFGPVNFNGANLNLQPINDTTSPYNGMLYFQRRWDTVPLALAGNSTQVMNGTVYAPWAQMNVSGNGSATFNAQLLVGSLSVSGNGTFTLNYSGSSSYGRGNQVYLVE